MTPCREGDDNQDEMEEDSELGNEALNRDITSKPEDYIPIEEWNTQQTPAEVFERDRGVVKLKGQRTETPIEDFIREAAVWVEKDGQTYFEMVMSTVHELERRFAAERRRAEAAEKLAVELKAHLDMKIAKNILPKADVGLVKDLESRLQEAEKVIEERGYAFQEAQNKSLLKITELEKEVERLKNHQAPTKEEWQYLVNAKTVKLEAQIKELEARTLR